MTGIMALLASFFLGLAAGAATEDLLVGLLVVVGSFFVIASICVTIEHEINRLRNTLRKRK